MDLVNRYISSNGHKKSFKNKASIKAECLIITCIDLTSSLYALFGFKDGQALILRSAGPLIPHYGPNCPAAQLFEENLRLAIHDQEITNIALIGHTACKAAEKLSKNLYGSGDIPRLRSLASPIMQMAINTCGNQNQSCIAHEIEKQILINGLKNLFDYPVILDGIKNSRLIIEGLQLDLENNRILKLNTDGRSFYFDEILTPIIDSADCGCTANLKESSTAH
jgi:carbonic anhydrase